MLNPQRFFSTDNQDKAGEEMTTLEAEQEEVDAEVAQQSEAE